MRDLLHPWLVPLLLVLAVLAALGARRAARRGRPTPSLLAHTERLTALPEFVVARRRQRLLQGARLASLAVAVAGCAVLVARPVDARTVEPDSRSRDVVLCLDVSSSMADTDAALARTFARIAEGSHGDRIGLVLFASRPVQVFPLTDDGAYAAAQLERVRAAYDSGNTGSAAWAGTTGGVGTSVIGDGAATCVSAFDRLDSPRVRSVVLATDDVVSGPQRVTLDQVGQLAADRGVRLYGLNPADPGGTGTSTAAQRFRAAVETSGGQYFPLSDAGAVPSVVAALRAREATRFQGSSQLLQVDDPGALPQVVAVAAGGYLLLRFAVEPGWAGGRRRRRAWSARGVPVLVVGLAAVLVWQPSLPGGRAPARSRDVDVYLVVDATLSMAAEDYRAPGAGTGDGTGAATRLSGVVADVTELTRRYAGARFSTIVSTSTAVQTMPLTTDTAAAVSSVAALVPSSKGSSRGSDPRQASALLQRVLSDGARTSPRRAQLVFYFGDGETTGEHGSGPFDDAGSSGGAVLGYGTPAGGPMRDAPLYRDPAQPYVQDTRPGHRGDAVSHEDPATLERIAHELGVPFVQRAPGDGVEAVVAGAPPGRLRPVAGSGAAERPVGWVAGGVLLLVLLGDGVHWWTRRRW